MFPQTALAAIKPEPSASIVAHSPDFSSIRWTDGEVYTFTPKQRPVAEALWQAMEDGTHFVGGAALLELAEANASRLRDLFRKSKAWGRVIVQGRTGTYRLASI